MTPFHTSPGRSSTRSCIDAIFPFSVSTAMNSQLMENFIAFQRWRFSRISFCLEISFSGCRYESFHEISHLRASAIFLNYWWWRTGLLFNAHSCQWLIARASKYVQLSRRVDAAAAIPFDLLYRYFFTIFSSLLYKFRRRYFQEWVFIGNMADITSI